ncbi:MAG: hypothetical protein K8L97_09245 [Anaerolineae bacterium]|nr:hypothetical protein [Anaerolineae bacterium]
MVLSDVREQLIVKLNDLTDQEVEALLRYVDVMQSTRLPEGYDEDLDPSVGFFSAESDYAERTEDILWTEFGLPKDQKDDK